MLPASRDSCALHIPNTPLSRLHARAAVVLPAQHPLPPRCRVRLHCVPAQAVRCVTECLALRSSLLLASSAKLAATEALAVQVQCHAGDYAAALALSDSNVRRLAGRFGDRGVELGEEYGKLAHIACLAGKVGSRHAHAHDLWTHAQS